MSSSIGNTFSSFWDFWYIINPFNVADILIDHFTWETNEDNPPLSPIDTNNDLPEFPILNPEEPLPSISTHPEEPTVITPPDVLEEDSSLFPDHPKPQTLLEATDRVNLTQAQYDLSLRDLEAKAARLEAATHDNHEAKQALGKIETSAQQFTLPSWNGSDSKIFAELNPKKITDWDFQPNVRKILAAELANKTKAVLDKELTNIFGENQWGSYENALNRIKYEIEFSSSNDFDNQKTHVTKWQEIHLKITWLVNAESTWSQLAIAYEKANVASAAFFSAKNEYQETLAIHEKNAALLKIATADFAEMQYYLESENHEIPKMMQTFDMAPSLPKFASDEYTTDGPSSSFSLENQLLHLQETIQLT